jgi:4-azaleucine resistance transporter AzlC
MKTKTRAFKLAFPQTIPVLAGFSLLGLAYGLLMSANGYNFIWSTLTSLFVFAGAGQYLLISLLASSFNPLYAFIIIFFINFRYVFYGVTMLEKYKGTGKMKPFLIHALCDETFATNSTFTIPDDIDKNWFYFFVTLFNYLYWAVGTLIGGLIGEVIVINIIGLDFVLTALFVVIFVDQWLKTKNHKPALLGVGVGLVSLLVFGGDYFIIPALFIVVFILIFFKDKLAKEVSSYDNQ